MINTEKLCMGCMNDNDGEQICPICGYDSSHQNHAQCLPVKSEIKNRYILGKALAVNGEGITYIAWDKSTDSIVKVKEYFPLGAAVRNPDTSVSILQEKKYVFNEGLLEFLEINRKIMEQSLTAMLQVNDVFEDNGTAFCVFENVQGITLADFLTRNGGTLKWEQARALLLPIIDAIKAMNDIGIIHKGISPETIIVGRDGKLRITDYSINNLRMADSEIENQLFEGYAAAEQYGIAEMQTGTYTDVYGFCATLFKVLIGTVVPKATLRMQDESMSIPSKFAEELPRHVLAALANGLKVKPNERTQDIETLKDQLVYAEIVEAQPKAKVEKSEKIEEKVKSKSMKSNVKYVAISAGLTALVFIVVGCILAFTVFKGDIFGTESNNSSSEPLASAPTVDAIGSVDSDAAESVKLYKVPDFVGKTYAEIIDDEENKVFQIIIAGKVYSDEVEKGKVCKQSLNKDSEVEKETKIEVTISLGSKEFKMPKLAGLTEQEAKLELLKLGFLYENIQVKDKYDEDSQPDVILEQNPAVDAIVNNDMVVEIYKNKYQGEEPMGGGDDDEILSNIVATTPKN